MTIFKGSHLFQGPSFWVPPAVSFRGKTKLPLPRILSFVKAFWLPAQGTSNHIDAKWFPCTYITAKKIPPSQEIHLFENLEICFFFWGVPVENLTSKTNLIHKSSQSSMGSFNIYPSNPFPLLLGIYIDVLSWRCLPSTKFAPNFFVKKYPGHRNKVTSAKSWKWCTTWLKYAVHSSRRAACPETGSTGSSRRVKISCTYEKMTTGCWVFVKWDLGCQVENTS